MFFFDHDQAILTELLGVVAMETSAQWEMSQVLRDEIFHLQEATGCLDCPPQPTVFFFSFEVHIRPSLNKNGVYGTNDVMVQKARSEYTA